MFVDLEIFLNKHKHPLPPAHDCTTSGKELASSEGSRSWKATLTPSFEGLHWAEMIEPQASWQAGRKSKSRPLLHPQLPCWPGEAMTLKIKGSLSCPQCVPNSHWSVRGTSGSSKLSPGGLFSFLLVDTAPSGQESWRILGQTWWEVLRETRLPVDLAMGVVGHCKQMWSGSSSKLVKQHLCSSSGQRQIFKSNTR